MLKGAGKRERKCGQLWEDPSAARWSQWSGLYLDSGHGCVPENCT